MEQSLQIGETIDNNQICEFFKCSPQGGMRRSLATNSLVLISNHIKSIYNDRWLKGVLNYTGMGAEGDQSLVGNQNRTLYDSETNGIQVHLFEVFEPKKYTYSGKVQLVGKPYQERQPDAEGNSRKVWIFPLKPSNKNLAMVSAESLEKVRVYREKRARRLTDFELKRRANQAPISCGNRKVVSQQPDRNLYVSEHAKRWAQGVCQLCMKSAPFEDKTGKPYLESHHIVWLSRGGSDTVDNTVAVCPNCHRKIHVLDSERDRQILEKNLQKHLFDQV
ncbi:HNH endonuclease [bacterium]|nr:HNH endonuclease [bacterium]